MGDVRRVFSCFWMCLVAMLAMCTAGVTPVSAADGGGDTGALQGRLTDIHSAPLAGVTVILRNDATGAEARTTTARNGAYRFEALVPGEYSLEAESEALGAGRLERIEVMAGHEARVQAAIELARTPATEIAARPVDEMRAVQPVGSVAGPALVAMPTLAIKREIPFATAAVETRLEEQSLAVQPLAGHRIPIAVSIPLESAVLTTEIAPVGSTQTLQPLPVRPLSVNRAHSNGTIPVETARLEAALPVESLHSLALAANALPALASVKASTFDEAAVREAVAAAAMAATIRQARMELNREQVQTTSPAVTTTITSEQLQQLPATGRHWQDFLVDTPAASANPGTSAISIRAGAQEAADQSVDGASTRLAFGSSAGATLPREDDAATGAQNQENAGQGWSGRSGAVAEAAVREVTVVAGNVDADGAHAAGGRTNVETQSGSNALHGQVFLHDRQNTWGARNPFTQWVQNTGTVALPNFTATPYTPPDREMAWGFGAGGRLRRNKLFWFAALDGYTRNNPGVAQVKDYAQLFAPPEPITASIVQLSAQLGETQNQAWQDYMGIPRNGIAQAGLEQLAGLLGPGTRSATQWMGFLRIDWQLAERHRLALEASHTMWNAPGGGSTRTLENYGTHSFGSSNSSQTWILARWEAFLTPNLLAVTQASAGRAILNAGPQTPSAFEQPFLNNNIYGQLPHIVVDSRYGFTIGNPSQFSQGSRPDEHLYSLQETVSWVKGRLLIKAGMALEHNTDAISLLRNQSGTFHYTKVSSFISDASTFLRFGTTNLFNFMNPHNCNATGKGLGALPCYSYLTQTLGPTFWQITTNDWAGFATAQWELKKWAVISAGMRWELEQLPPPIKLVDNPALPGTEKLPSLGSQWGPRVSLALGGGKHWPVLRVGYGIYFGRTTNATLLAAITQTGSLKGDLDYFIRPTDGMNPGTGTSAAPPFPNPLNGTPSSVIVPGAVEYASNFHNSQIHQGVVSLEEKLPWGVQLTASAMASLGRKLPISIDTNYDANVNPRTITYAVEDLTGQGPIKTPTITVPFYAMWPSSFCAGSLMTVTGKCGRANPSYQQITQIESRANSTYEAGMLRIARYSARGLSFTARYTFAHAADWNPNESTLVAGSDVLDPKDLRSEYGTGNLDVRHSAAVTLTLQSPWKVRKAAKWIANGWKLSSVGQFRSGLPYSMHTSGSIPEMFDANNNPIVVGIGPGMNGSGGDNRVYGVPRNTFRHPSTWKADMRVTKEFDLGDMRRLELMVESFNLFNHRNTTQVETTGYEIQNSGAGALPTLTFLTQGTTGTAATTPAFGQPRNINGTNFYRERQIQIGARFRF